MPGRDHLDGGDITTGAAVMIEGTVVESPGGKQAVEVAVTSIKLVGGADASTFPLQKKRHTLEYLRGIAHLRPRTNTIGAVTRVRNQLAYATHTFFEQHGFQSQDVVAGDTVAEAVHAAGVGGYVSTKRTDWAA